MKWMTLTLLCVVTACNSTSSAPPRASASGFASPQADLSQYQTFSFGSANPPAEGYQTTARSLEVQRRLTPLVEALLAKRGYAQSPDGADLVIKISTGYGTAPGEKLQRGNPTPERSSGFIGVDAYDRVTGAAVWHGSAVAEINPERIDDRLLARGVEHIMADFPSRSGDDDHEPLGALDR